MDLLSWPMPESVESDAADPTVNDGRSAAQLRAELAETMKELRRLRARVQELEAENAQLLKKSG